jgi:hypothetical protein
MIRHAWTLLLVPVLLAGGVAPHADAAQRTVVRVQQRGRGIPPRAVPRPDTRRPGRVVPNRPQDRRGPYQEPAFARGYADGYTSGSDDSRDRERYDPVGDRAYRSGDQGYYREYGSREAYRNNYRAGFRQGYDDGYRENGRGRR